MEIPTMTDYKRLEDKFDMMLQKIEALHDKKSSVLTSENMCRMMKISLRTFNHRLPDLVKFGAYKIGRQWRMAEADFDHYIESNKSFM